MYKKDSFMTDACRPLCLPECCDEIIFTLRLKKLSNKISSLKNKILLQPGNFELVVSDKEIIHFNKSRELMSKFFMRVFG